MAQTNRPTPEELEAAIRRHVEWSSAFVKTIPPEKRTILSLAEARQRQNDLAKK